MTDPPDYQRGERRLHYADPQAGTNAAACHTWHRSDTTTDPDLVDCRKCRNTIRWRRAKGLVILGPGGWQPAPGITWTQAFPSKAVPRA